MEESTLFKGQKLQEKIRKLQRQLSSVEEQIERVASLVTNTNSNYGVDSVSFTVYHKTWQAPSGDSIEDLEIEDAATQEILTIIKLNLSHSLKAAQKEFKEL